MEEKKEKKVKKETPSKEKMSYEDLEKAAIELDKRCSFLYQKLQEAQKVIADFNEIGLLLSILKEAEYFDDSFITLCSSKIQETVTKALSPQEEPKE